MGELTIVMRTKPAVHGSTELGIVGPITQATAPALRDALRGLIDSDPERAPSFRLDLTCCTQLDYAGLLALSVAQHAARLRGGDLHLIDVPPLLSAQVRRHNFIDLLGDDSDEDLQQQGSDLVQGPGTDADTRW